MDRMVRVVWVVTIQGGRYGQSGRYGQGGQDGQSGHHGQGGQDGQEGQGGKVATHGLDQKGRVTGSRFSGSMNSSSVDSCKS